MALVGVIIRHQGARAGGRSVVITAGQDEVASKAMLIVALLYNVDADVSSVTPQFIIIMTPHDGGPPAIALFFRQAIATTEGEVEALGRGVVMGGGSTWRRRGT